MNRLGIEAIEKERFAVDVSDDGAGIAVRFSGDIDMSDPSGILDPLFESVHTGVLRGKIALVSVDFTALNFLNSSGIKAIAKWIMKMAAVAPEQRYRIKLFYDKSITWQATSLPTLTFLVPGTVEIE